MFSFHTLDDEAHAELLSYLVVAELVARARTGEWLRTDRLVESARIWLVGAWGKSPAQDIALLTAVGSVPWRERFALRQM